MQSVTRVLQGGSVDARCSSSRGVHTGVGQLWRAASEPRSSMERKQVAVDLPVTRLHLEVTTLVWVNSRLTTSTRTFSTTIR